MKSGSTRSALLLFVAFLAAGCGGSLEQSFDLAYLTYARPDYPYGSLVACGYSPESGWQIRQEAELFRNAVLLFPPPFPAGTLQYLAVESRDGERYSALWQWPHDTEEAPQKLFELPGRVVLLWANSPAAHQAALIYVAAGQVELRSAEYDREVVSLRPNARCSVAVLRYAQPDSLLLLGSCRYARAEWFTAGRLGYVTRSNLLVAVDLDSLRTDTLQRNVEAFSVALGTGAYAVGFNGDSLAVFGADGARLGEAVSDAAVPQISPNGSRLAYHAEDYGVWILSLASGESREVGVGYPVRWSADGTLLLFFERQVDDRRVTHTIYHVAGAENGATATLPADGFIVDATFAR